MSTFNGKITEISEIRTGESNGKEWASLEFEVTELNPQNPNYPQIGLFGYFKNGEYAKYAKEFNNNFKVGDEVTVDYNLKCVEYDKKDGSGKGKFYKTEAWKVQKLESAPSEIPQPPFEPVTDLNNSEDDDMPFN